MLGRLSAGTDLCRWNRCGGCRKKACSNVTGLDFERTWRSLAGQQEQQAQYLLLLRPQQLPALLQASLTAPLLASLLPPLLSLLAEECDADHAVRSFMCSAILHSSLNPASTLTAAVSADESTMISSMKISTASGGVDLAELPGRMPVQLTDQ